MKKIGVVLSGGGALATAHLGLLKVLEEQNIKPTHLSGNSAGACVAALYNNGYSIEEILSIMKKEDWLTVPFQKLKEQKILSVEDMFGSFKDYLPKNFTSNSLYIAVTDINTGKTVSYNKGELRTILKASAALSTFFKPVNYDRKNLVDSALLDNFHVEPLINKCDVIYGSYAIPMTSYSPMHEENVQGLLNRLFAINGYQRAKLKFDKCNYMIDHQYLKDFKVLDRHKIDVIYQKSYEYCKKELSKIEV